MVNDRKLKEAEINENQSTQLLTWNLVRLAIFDITCIRGLFPKKFFNNEWVPALDIYIKNLKPIESESRRLIDAMDKVVFDAIQRKYLKTLVFSICQAGDGPTIEEYSFSFRYPDSVNQNIIMSVNRTGNNNQADTFNSTADIPTKQIKTFALKMYITLGRLMTTIDKIPKECTLVMKLLYYNDVTPPDYEPPFFRVSAVDEGHYVGNVNSKYLVLTLKVKSVLDPSENENEDMQDDGQSTGPKSPDSVHDYQPSDSDRKDMQDDGKCTRSDSHIMDKLEKGTLKMGKDTHIANKDKCEFAFLKDEADGQTAHKDGNPVSPEDIKGPPSESIDKLLLAINQLTEVIAKNFAKDPLESLKKEREELSKFVLTVGGLTTVASLSSPPGGVDGHGHIRFSESPLFHAYLVCNDIAFALSYANYAFLHKPLEEQEDKANALRKKINRSWAVLWLTVMCFFASFTLGFWMVYPAKEEGKPNHESWPRWFVMGVSIAKVVGIMVLMFGRKCWNSLSSVVKRHILSM